MCEMDRRVPPFAAVRLAAPQAGLAGLATALATDDPAVGNRVRLQQCGLLLGAAVHPGAERAVDPVFRTAVGGALVAAAVRATADLGATCRDHDLPRGRTHHRAAGRFQRAHYNPVQQGRSDVWEFAGRLRALLGADDTPASDASTLAYRLYDRLRRLAAAAVLNLGILNRFYVEA